jgi:hypothetical protein
MASGIVNSFAVIFSTFKPFVSSNDLLLRRQSIDPKAVAHEKLLFSC